MTKAMASRIRTGEGRHPLDAYQTPEEVTEAALRFIKHDRTSRVLEPCCGDGRILRVLRRHKFMTKGLDVRRSQDQDFFKLDRWDGDLIMNPPYRHGLMIRFIDHALRIAAGRVTALLPSSALWGEQKARRWRGEWGTPDHVVVISNRIYFHKEGSDDRIAGQFFSHAWFSWSPDRGSPDTRIDFATAGGKPR